MTNKTNKSNSPLSDLRTKYSEIRLAIKAHQEKNTNAHKGSHINSNSKSHVNKKTYSHTNQKNNPFHCGN